MGESREYKLVSAVYRDRAFPDSLLLVDDRGEIELRQWTGKGKRVKTPVVRFHPELPVSVRVDGVEVRISELSVSLETPQKAAEVAELLERPLRAQEAERSLSEVEANVKEFLGLRGQAVASLSELEADPRRVLVGTESLWTGEVSDPVESYRSAQSEGLAAHFDRLTLSLAAAEGKLGPVVFERLCALACTLASAQDAALKGGGRLDQVLSALQELGVEATPEDLDSVEVLLQRAHPSLAALAVEQSLRA